MARFYGTKILKGDMTIERVPQKWKVETEIWIMQNQ